MDTSLKVSIYKFSCEKCQTIFEGVPQKREYMHPVYGACTSFFSNCPDCGGEAGEYHQPKPKSAKRNNNSTPCGSSSCSCCM